MIRDCALALPSLMISSPATCFSVHPGGMGRRETFFGVGGAITSVVAPQRANAAVKKVSARDGALAYARIVEARAELNKVEKMVAGGDFSGAAALLQAPVLANFEADSTMLVQSPVLTAEDKKTIGTIRT